MNSFRGNITGIWCNTKHGMFEGHDFYVQYTSDKMGRSLSIANDQTGDMFQIPFNELYKVIAKEVKKHD